MSAKEFVKMTSTVPAKFVDELFEFYDETTNQTDTVIRLDVVAKWLSANKDILAKTLRKSYRAGFDYVVELNTKAQKSDPRSNNHKLYLITPDCFKRLAMTSRSKNAEMVRTYFIEIENMFLKYRMQTLQGMQHEIERLERNQRDKKGLGDVDPKAGYLYVIRASEHKDGIFKIGRSKDLLSRLRNYDSGRADDIEVMYMYQVPDIVSAEGCVKALLKKYKYRKYKEVYQADIDMIKDLVKGCGDLSAKLYHKNQKMLMKGGFYIVLEKEL